MSTGSKLNREELTEALNRAMRDVSAMAVLYSQAVADRLGVNSSDLECLDFIAMRGAMTAGELADAAGLTTGAITGVIDRLERAGFAKRQRDKEDRRKVLVVLTPAVERRIMPLYEPIARSAVTTFAAYSDEELALLLGFIERSAAGATAALAELRGQAKGTVKKKNRRDTQI
jgi:DNA-binding MarR family transcriptional regulator